MSDAAQGRDVVYFGEAFACWRLDVDTDEGSLVLFYFRTLGGGMTAAQREEIFEYYRTHVLGERVPYMQLFDLQRGFEDASSHLWPLADFCRSIRSLQRGCLRRSLLISDDPLTRGVVRCVMRLAPPPAPFLVCSTEEQAWRHMLEGLAGAEEVWDEVRQGEAVAATVCPGE